MDFNDSISFSSIIAGMLLCMRSVSAIEIINTVSIFSSEGIDIDDENDDIQYLSCCVDFNKDCSFSLKDGFDYSTKLASDITVYQFLENVAGERVISFFANDAKYRVFYQNNYQQFYEFLNHSISSYQLKNDKSMSKKRTRTGRFSFVTFLTGSH